MRSVKNAFKTAVLLAGLGGLLMVIGGLLTRGSPVGFLIGGGIGLLIVGFSYWKSDVLAIKAARAVPVTKEQMPEFYEIMEELTRKADMPMPKLYVAPSEQPNAFATGRNPDHAAVAVTQGILRILNWEELRGVLAHEISHVGNRDILISSVAAAIALGITMIAGFLRFAAIFGGGGRDDRDGNPLAMLALAILAPIAAGMLQMALSRGREFEADRTGARLIGDGEPLARALEKLEAGSRQIPMEIDPAHAQAYIVNPLAAVKNLSFKNLWSSHPPTAERVKRLRTREWEKAW